MKPTGKKGALSNIFLIVIYPKRKSETFLRSLRRLSEMLKKHNSFEGKRYATILRRLPASGPRASIHYFLPFMQLTNHEDEVEKELEDVFQCMAEVGDIPCRLYSFCHTIQH